MEGSREGFGDSIPSSELLSKERIMKYYKAINRQYSMGTEEGIKAYIRDMLDKAPWNKAMPPVDK